MDLLSHELDERFRVGGLEQGQFEVVTVVDAIHCRELCKRKRSFECKWMKDLACFRDPEDSYMYSIGDRSGSELLNNNILLKPCMLEKSKCAF